MKLFTDKTLRRPLFFGITAFLIAAVLALQLFLFSFLREARFFGDMTTEGLYTMTDLMRSELRDVKEDVSVVFCMDADRCLNDPDLRLVYILAKELEDELPNIKVETLSLRNDSTAADKYKVNAVTEIAEDDVIVSYGQKNRVASADVFYTLGEDNNRWSFKGEYQLATMILSVVRVFAPVCYFTVDNGEAYYDPELEAYKSNTELSAFRDSLSYLGMSVKPLSLASAEKVPDDCVLLLMNGPTKDYDDSDPTTLGYASSLQKIDDYLTGGGSFMYVRNSEVKQSTLPAISEFLAEWGIAYNDDEVYERRVSESDERTTLSVTYATAETSAVAHSLYEAMANLVTAPRTLIKDTSSLYCPWIDTTQKNILDTVERKAAPLFFSAENSATRDESGKLLEDGGSFPVGMITVEATLRSDATYDYSYMLALGSTSFLTDGFYATQAYGNRDMTMAILRTLTSTDSYAASDLGSPTDMNSENYGGKRYESDAFVEKETLLYVKDGDRILASTPLSDGSGYSHVRTMHPISTASVVWLMILILSIPLIIIPAACIIVVTRRRHL